MKQDSEIERAIGKELPPFLEKEVVELAHLLEDIINDPNKLTQAIEILEKDVKLNRTVALLIGKKLSTKDAVITFGTENQFGTVNIGDIAQGNIFKITVNFSAQSPHNTLTQQEVLRLQVHKAYFSYSPMECVFINVVNTVERDVEITHIWFDTDPPIHILNPNRPLPKRLRPEETWETWIETYKLPASLQSEPYSLAKARVSTGLVVSSQKNTEVPTQGFVPGGPITLRIMQLDTTNTLEDAFLTCSISPDVALIHAQDAGITASNPVSTKNMKARNVSPQTQGKIHSKVLQSPSHSSRKSVGKGKKRNKRRQR